MKKDFLQEFQSLLKNKKVETNQSPKFTGYNVDNQGVKIERRNNAMPQQGGYLRMTARGEEYVTKEQIITEMINYVRNFLMEYKNVVPPCQVTENEWRTFFEISYNHFEVNGLSSGYIRFMQMSLNYVLFGEYIKDVSAITLQTVIENFNVDFLPFGVADGMTEAIRKEVYLTTQKDNIINFQEYQHISRR